MKFQKNINENNGFYDENNEKQLDKLNQFHHTFLDISASKKIDSLLQKSNSSTMVSKIVTKCLINKSELRNAANTAIAAAECASSSTKIHGPKRKQLYRKAGGKVWYDPTMGQWSNDDFRLFVGNLGKEVNDHMLSLPFLQYPSFIKAYVVKNRETSLSRGCYGFVSFGNSVDYLRAIKELNGKYVGSRPIKIEKSIWKKRSLK